MPRVELNGIMPPPTPPEVRSNFQQFHCLLAVRETFLLKEMDDIVTTARQELKEKKEILQELDTAREGLERDLTKNKLN